MTGGFIALLQRRRRAAALVLALLAGAVIIWCLAAGPAWFGANGAPSVRLSGNIEAHESVLSFTQVQAPIVELAFDEGRPCRPAPCWRASTIVSTASRSRSTAPMSQSPTAQVAVNESNLAAAQSNVASDQFDLVGEAARLCRAERSW